MVTDCGWDLECDTFFANRHLDTLFLDFNSIPLKDGSYCPGTNCACEYALTFYLKAKKTEFNILYLREDDITNQYDRYKTRQSPSFEILYGDTINYTDQYGIKKGLWLESDSLGNLKKEVIMYKGQECGYSRSFYKNQKIKSTIFEVELLRFHQGLFIIHKKYNAMGLNTFSDHHQSGKIRRVRIQRNESGYLEEIRVDTKDDEEVIIR